MSRNFSPVLSSRNLLSPNQANRLSPHTYLKHHSYLPVHSLPSKISTPAQSEIRPSDSISQLDANTAVSAAPRAPIDMSPHPSDSGETTSSFSVASSFSGTHLPDLPPLPSITPSPHTDSSSPYEDTSQPATFSSRLNASMPHSSPHHTDPTNQEADGVRYGAALLRRAVELERSERDRHHIRGAVTDVGMSSLRKSWRQKLVLEGAFDPVAQSLLSAAEYHQLVDRMLSSC